MSSYGAAAYLAVIAYPNSFEKRDTFINACTAWVGIQIGKGRLPLRLAKNAAIQKHSKTRAHNAEFNSLIKQLEKKRAVALHICKGMISKQAGITVRLEGGETLTISNYLRKNYVATGEADHAPKNAHSRVWVESKPVLHLIWALENYLHRTNKTPSVQNLLLDASWVAEAVNEAESLRLNVLKNIQLTLKADERWIDIDKMIQLLPE